MGTQEKERISERSGGETCRVSHEARREIRIRNPKTGVFETDTQRLMRHMWEIQSEAEAYLHSRLHFK